MKKDIRLENITMTPSDNPLISKKQQIEIIHKAIDQVFDGGGHIMRRIPFNEDYRRYPPEE